ncbi:alpha/beta hydrolase [Sphingopyxis sp. XHP0097]|uniref:Alpha/beta hydrolase n=1 Tax=Sphingopyxis jiangsuensis TaxID=2871171 RepID=A0ABS7MEZ3_9SPHN|nr:alpha/beta hydrolase [Sphingopyxis jiangsuensis]MBY4637612.1 alpha/beta hydrolase [Sphingopyxis jiangsuensis]
MILLSLPRRRTILATAALLSTVVALGAASPALLAQTPAARTAATAEAAPTRSGHAEVAGARFYYEVHGDPASDKTPLLVLHGAFMSGEAMRPFVTPFVASRPVITIDARGHGRTGDIGGTMSYDQLADDAAGVLAALGVKRADVLGYSMGGSTAIALAVRHPRLIDKQVVVSGGASLVEAIKHIDAVPFAYSDAQLRAIPGKTMIVLGDADGLTLDHAVKLFRLRGGSDLATATQGFMTAPPKARLSVLPGTSHIGIMAEAATIAAQALPFLDEQTPPMPEGFF